MASGRLAAAVVPSGRTQLVYTNNSGGAVSATILTRSLDSTQDAIVSMAIDSASVTPETFTQIDTTSRNFETTPLVFFNSANTAVEGDMTMLNTASFMQINDGGTAYGVDNKYLTGALPVPTMTGGAKEFNPSGRPLPTLVGSTVYSKLQSEIDADLPYWYRTSMNDTVPSAGYQQSQSLSYTGRAWTVDPYTEGNPFWTLNGNKYMSWGYITNSNGSITESNRTSDSWYYQEVGGGAQQNFYRTIFMARGGVFGYGSNSSGRVSFQIYKGWNNQMSSNYLDPDTGGTSNKGLHIDFSFGGTQAFDGSSLKWVEFNPHTDKVYACFWEGSRGFVMMEMDGPKLEALFTAHQSSSKTAVYNDIAAAVTALGNDNPFTDITSSMPSSWDKTNANWYMTPTFRIGDRLWYVNEGSTTTPLDANNKGWITSDFKNWTEVTPTSYYETTLGSDLAIASDADSTDLRQGNFNSVAKSGRLETDTTFSEIERTGLVLSNSDKLYVRNGGTTDVNIQVMGFEEGS